MELCCSQDQVPLAQPSEIANISLQLDLCRSEFGGQGSKPVFEVLKACAWWVFTLKPSNTGRYHTHGPLQPPSTSRVPSPGKNTTNNHLKGNLFSFVLVLTCFNLGTRFLSFIFTLNPLLGTSSPPLNSIFSEILYPCLSKWPEDAFGIKLVCGWQLATTLWVYPSTTSKFSLSLSIFLWTPSRDAPCQWNQNQTHFLHSFRNTLYQELKHW